MYDTTSVFDVLAADETDRRVASRRALALAHTRVENRVGAFLRQASSQEDFDARMAACQEEFEGLVATAAAEHSYDKPEYLVTSLRDHYIREAMVKEAPGKKHMKGVSDKDNRMYEHIKENLEESGKDEDRAKEEAARTVNKYRHKHHKDSGFNAQPATTPQQAIQNVPPVTPPPSTPQQMQQMQGQPAVMPDALQPQDLGQQQQPMLPPQQPGLEAFGSTRRWTPFLAESAKKKHWIQDAVKRPGQLHRDLGVPQGEKIPEGKLEEAEHSSDPKERERAQFAENMKGLHHKKKKGAEKEAMPLVPGPPEARDEYIRNWLNDDTARARGQREAMPFSQPLDRAAPQGQRLTPEAQGDVDMLNQRLQQPMQYSVPAPSEDPQMLRWQQAPEEMGNDEPYYEDMYGDVGSDNLEAYPPRRAAFDPADQTPPNQSVTCPECGGNGKTANRKKCPKCGGTGRVSDYGSSVLDKVATEDGNTDLGGPEPKMDKRLWTPQSVGEPNVDDGAHPTKRKDILEPIKAENEGELTEIGEKTNDREKLPNNSGDAGWDAGGPGPAPHTDTWSGKGDQVDPVTRSALD